MSSKTLFLGKILLILTTYGAMVVFVNLGF